MPAVEKAAQRSFYLLSPLAVLKKKEGFATSSKAGKDACAPREITEKETRFVKDPIAESTVV
ncbi:MAG: hypothetical protein HYR56_17865 [Acidobacteria bacterium]|nr:hypothetical protein [Acidobacteriota bacterium]MBI3426043.1 hypothetical protein [Acidobacteriota bacterium]